MVPTTFTENEVNISRDYLINKVKNNSRFIKGRVLGNPYTFYKELATLLNYEYESHHDGDRLGILAAHINKIEVEKSGLLLSAVIISKEYGRPGPGFYKDAEEYGLYDLMGRSPNPDGMKELTFWDGQVKEVVEKYGKKK